MDTSVTNNISLRNRIFFIIISLCLINTLLISAWGIKLNLSTKKEDITNRENILILAPHHDDALIMAGATIIKNAEIKGDNHIFYFSPKRKPDQLWMRYEEALNAWGSLDSEYITLYQMSQTTTDALTHGITDQRLKKLLADKAVTRIIFPLLELGNHEHDEVNKIGWALSEAYPHIVVTQAAEYNPYYIAENSPLKLLGFFIRLLPHIPYVESTSGLIPSNQVKVNVSQEILDKKIHLLSLFYSQQGTISSGQFGNLDIFENTRHLPDSDLHLLGKHFSYWSIISLSLWLATLICLSLLLGSTIKKSKVPGLLAASIVTPPVWMLYNIKIGGSWYVMQDGLTSIIIYTAMIIGMLVFNSKK